jgi:hypothetical protein
MVNFERSARLRAVPSPRRLGAWLLSAALLFAAAPPDLLAQAPPAEQAPATPAYTPQSPEQLQQLVAPIALYPDSLVAAILPAATFPEQIVEADRWLQANPDLTGDDLAQAVNQEPWDASVKALAAFPAVLGNMDQNLSWTSSLGEAYYNQPQDVMAAVQVLRRSAEAAGSLQGTPEQDVTTEGSDIDIEPTEPDVVYVPEYDPWAVYGIAIDAWPGWYDYPGIWYPGPYLSFGIGSPIGFFRGYPWAWHHWRCDWRSRYVAFNHAPYASRSVTFFNRNNFYRSAAARGEFHTGTPGRFGAAPDPYGGNFRAPRVYAASHRAIGMRSGAFTRFAGARQMRSFAPRARAGFSSGGFRGGGARGGGRSAGHGGGRGGGRGR